MKVDQEKMAAEIAANKDLVDMLEKVLRPGDHAWVVCSWNDCIHHLDGRCSIHTIAAPPRFIGGKPCASFEKRA